MTNVHSEYDEIYGADDAAQEGKPHGWIQWKGTDVCMDIYCDCGYTGHVDGQFFYHYRCVGCGRRFAVGQNVALIPLRDDQRPNADCLEDVEWEECVNKNGDDNAESRRDSRTKLPDQREG